MTLSDLAKYSVTVSITWCLRQLTFLLLYAEGIFATLCYAKLACAIMQCLYVRLSIRHVHDFCQNE